MMTSHINKARFFGAIFALVTAGTISVSAQTPAVASAAKVNPVTTRDTGSTAHEKQAGPAAEATAESGEEPVVKRSSEVSDSVAADAGTKEGPAATTKSANATPPQTSSDGWQFQLTPYLFIPTISGRTGIGDRVIETDASITDSGIELNFGFMATFEARKDKFVILTDLLYADLATERGNPGPFFSSTRASFKAFVLDPEVGYRILDNGEGAFVDVLGGIRYWNIDATLAFGAGILPATEVSRSRGWVDGIAGLRGRAALSERWFVTGKADLGGGGSNFTYQLFGGVGFAITKRVALIGGYRDLSVNYNKDGFLFDMSLHGPIFGLGFKF